MLEDDIFKGQAKLCGGVGLINAMDASARMNNVCHIICFEFGSVCAHFAFHSLKSFFCTDKHRETWSLRGNTTCKTKT